MATYNPAYDFGGGVNLIGQSRQTLPAGGSFVDGIYYFMAPSKDGGWNFYRAVNNDAAGETDVQSISQADYRGPDMQGNYQDTTEEVGATSGTGLTPQEIQAKLAEWQSNKKAVDQAYQDGLLTWQERRDALDQSRQMLGKNKDQGLESNSAYFSAVSPDAFQSQIGNYNQKVLDAYQQGQNTVQNDQAKIDYYKNNLEGNYADQTASLNTFNPATGQYGNNFSLTPTVAAPTLTPIDTGINKLSAGQVPQWAPNYGGLSTMQAKVDPNDPYSYLKK